MQRRITNHEKRRDAMVCKLLRSVKTFTNNPFYTKLKYIKGQLISKENCQAVNSSKKRTNESVFTTMQLDFVRFLEEIEDTKMIF